MRDVVLVTGASGFIGQHLVAALREGGAQVRELSRRDGDIARRLTAVPDVSHVYHLAGRTSVTESWTSPREYYDTNVVGTVSVLEYCRHSRAGLTFVSSYVYGTPQRLPIDEEHPLDAVNPYGHSKILAEEVCRYYAVQFGVPIAVIRPFNIYGPGQRREFLIPSLLAQALDASSAAITVADVRPRRDFLHVDDFVRLLLAARRARPGRAYNAGSGASTSIEELVSIINRHVPHPKRLISLDERRPVDVLDVIADVSRARDELGWMPRIPLEVGLSRMIAG